MALLMLKDVPRYECLLKAAERYPSLDPSACEAFFHLLRAGDLVSETQSRFLGQRGVSQGRFTVLMLLNRCGSHFSTPAELADEAGVSRATMTGLIDTLEKDELVLRKTDPADRRTVLVHLTHKGQSLIEEMLPDYFRCVSAIIEPLSEAERKQLVALLQKLDRGRAPEAGRASVHHASVNS